MTKRAKPKLSVVLTDMERAAKRMEHIRGFKVVPPIASSGAPPERSRQVSHETFCKVLAVHLRAAEPESAL